MSKNAYFLEKSCKVAAPPPNPRRSPVAGGSKKYNGSTQQQISAFASSARLRLFFALNSAIFVGGDAKIFFSPESRVL